jgi:hypothetical protein
LFFAAKPLGAARAISGGSDWRVCRRNESLKMTPAADNWRVAGNRCVDSSRGRVIAVRPDAA